MTHRTLLTRAVIASTFLLASVPTHADIVLTKTGTTYSGHLRERIVDAKSLAMRPLILLTVPDSGATARTVPIRLADISYIVIEDSTSLTTFDVEALLQARDATYSPRLAIGANLDFLEGITVTNPFYSLRAELPDLYSAQSQRAGSLFLERAVRHLLPSGFSLGFEQGRLFGRDTSTSTVTTFASDEDTVGRTFTFREAALHRTDVTDLNLGIYWRVLETGTRPTRARVWAVLLAEYRRVRRSTSVTALGTPDTLFGAYLGGTSTRADVPLSFGVKCIAELPGALASVLVTLYNYPDIGISYYLVQGEVRELKHGITITGEVRVDNPDPTYGYGTRDVLFQVALSKTFTLEKLVEFLVKS